MYGWMNFEAMRRVRAISAAVGRADLPAGGTTLLGYAVADSGMSDAVVTGAGMDATRQAGELLRYVEASNYVQLLYRVNRTHP